ncbi:site-specific integrase [Lysobacter sp. 5GHs7-4]|uniref:tyrosine-type recombinase/integrase n=1 Tax=Lysobacter sp. 5GHs7-4 TaxID=2904253 RepID=UPI001E5AE7E0|nr:site-specific integrase [Lysobacter sp. 5GHs7-4]UHQ21939.1 site-specific integrase [Lysobacter sp. 5GHs7-4]
MASIRPSGSKWRVQVYVAGVRDSQIFATRKEAATWGLEREAELRGAKLPDKTFGDAMKRYQHDEAPKRGGAHWEAIRLKAFRETPIANRRLASLDGNDFADWRDRRLAQVKPGTVAREMNLLRAVLEVARRDWRWIRANPMKDVRWPTTPKGRARRLSLEEIEDLAIGFGVWDKLRAKTATQRVGLAFLLAIETGMRSGEILSLTSPNVHLDEQYVSLPKTKNGDARDVPLSKRAVEILRALPLRFGPIFDMDASMRDTLFRKVRDKTNHRAVHFHDSRSEAIWRLSKKLDVLQLARVVGHRDIKSLMIYYNEPASELAKQLG